MIAGLAIAGAVHCGPAFADNPLPSQSTWVNASKDLNDPRLTYTQKYYCNQDTPSNQSTLFPYNVPTSGYEFAWRNNSSKGVTVTFNSTSTDDMDNAGDAFFVTSLHVSGDYALRVSFQCQSNESGAGGSVLPPTLQTATSTSATIAAGFGITDACCANTGNYQYYVQYGTSYADYTQQTARQDATWGTGQHSETITIPNLQPSTTYHYRVAIYDSTGDVDHATSYSGEDQTFTTPATGLGGARPDIRELVFGARKPLRLTAQGSAERVLARAPDSRSASQEWRIVDAGRGRSTRLVDVRTGLCLDVRRHSLHTGAAVVTDRCRRNSGSQEWVQARVGASWRLTNAYSHRALSAQPATKTVAQEKVNRGPSERLLFEKPPRRARAQR